MLKVSFCYVDRVNDFVELRLEIQSNSFAHFIFYRNETFSQIINDDVSRFGIEFSFLLIVWIIVMLW